MYFKSIYSVDCTVYTVYCSVTVRPLVRSPSGLSAGTSGELPRRKVTARYCIAVLYTARYCTAVLYTARYCSTLHYQVLQ